MGKGSRLWRIVTLLCLTVALASCGGDEGGQAAEPDSVQNNNNSNSNGNGGSTPEPDPDPAPPQNASPTISGKPADTVVAGSQYRFTPSADDADDDVLLFQIQNKPEWAAFDPSTGELSGTPQDADVRTYSNIVIRVSDGEATAQLPAFSITVESIGLGSATLTWVAPTLRTDGTLLDDLAGYKVYWGTESRNYTESIQIDNPGVTTYIVENLGPGTHYFATTALSSDGLESDYSNEASKTIQ